ncbi:MAG: hypothetical protein M3P48_11215 [Actinomycetota bacterium]|nr:hypothetical protein [Actinomycetota bacterium]
MTEQTAGPAAADENNPYRRLPEAIRVEDTVASHDTTPPPDPDGGRDPERDFMLRYAG